MSKQSIQKMSKKEIQQKIKRIENNNKFIEAKIEKIRNQLKLEKKSTKITQKIKEWGKKSRIYRHSFNKSKDAFSHCLLK